MAKETVDGTTRILYFVVGRDDDRHTVFEVRPTRPLPRCLKCRNRLRQIGILYFRMLQNKVFQIQLITQIQKEWPHFIEKILPRSSCVFRSQRFLSTPRSIQRIATALFHERPLLLG